MLEIHEQIFWCHHWCCLSPAPLPLLCSSSYFFFIFIMYCISNIYPCTHLLLLGSLVSQFWRVFLLSPRSMSWFPTWPWSLISQDTCWPLFHGNFSLHCFKSHLWRFLFLHVGLGSSGEGTMFSGPYVPLSTFLVPKKPPWILEGLRTICVQEASVRPALGWMLRRPSKSSFFKAALYRLSSAKHMSCQVQARRTSNVGISCQPFLLPCPEPLAGSGFLCA